MIVITIKCGTRLAMVVHIEVIAPMGADRVQGIDLITAKRHTYKESKKGKERNMIKVRR